MLGAQLAGGERVGGEQGKAKKRMSHKRQYLEFKPIET